MLIRSVNVVVANSDTEIDHTATITVTVNGDTTCQEVGTGLVCTMDTTTTHTIDLAADVAVDGLTGVNIQLQQTA